jgi:hypothetical protein
VHVLLPVVLPVLAGLLLRRLGAVLAALGLPGWLVWEAAAGRGPSDLGLALAFAAAGGLLLGSAGALLRPLVFRRRNRDAGSTW